MDRMGRFLLAVLVVFVLACWFFWIQPWTKAVDAPMRWLLIALRAGEIVALYAIAHGLWIWAGADTIKWEGISMGCLLMLLALLVLAMVGYVDWKRDMYSPWLPEYVMAWAAQPYLWRSIGVGMAMAVVLLFRVLGSHRLVFVISVLCIVVYRLIPELHILLFPAEQLGRS